MIDPYRAVDFGCHLVSGYALYKSFNDKSGLVAAFIPDVDLLLYYFPGRYVFSLYDFHPGINGTTVGAAVRHGVPRDVAEFITHRSPWFHSMHSVIVSYLTGSRWDQARGAMFALGCLSHLAIGSTERLDTDIERAAAKILITAGIVALSYAVPRIPNFYKKMHEMTADLWREYKSLDNLIDVDY